MKRHTGVIIRTAWALLFAGSAGALKAQTIFPLPQVFANASSVGSSNSLWQQITNGFYQGYVCTQSNDFRRFRGVWMAQYSTSKLALHSDDGSRVLINGATVLDFYGQNTHFQDSSALRLIPYTFTADVQYCVQIDYTNNQHTAGDIDGVTLYAYDGGGFVYDGIAVWGPDVVCLGQTVTLECCGDPAFTWFNSAPGVVSMSANGSSATLLGLAPGTATLIATDGHGKSGSRTVKVVRLGITPSYLETCEGLTYTFFVTNADVSGVTWVPTGSPSANGRTNTYTFSTAGGIFTAGTNLITATWSGCSGTATAVVVRAASLTASTNKLCLGGQVIYTAQSTPPGFEHFLNWSGEGLMGVGTGRTNSYSTSGVKTVTVSCGTSTRSVNVTVHKADITNSVGYGLAGSSTPANFYLSADSVGPFTWEIAPSGGPSVSGGAVTIPAGTTSGVYTVKVYPSGLPSCSDTATLQVVQVTLPTDPITLCKDSSTNLNFSVNPSSVLSLLTFDTVTNTSFGPANTHASVSVNNTNLTVTGLAGGTAYVRVKLGTTTLIGPTITIVQVTFPPEAWYVGVGKSADFNVTIVPSNTPVTFDTTAPGIATATAIPGGVRVTGVGPGTNQIRAKIPSGAACSMKQVIAVRVEFPADELTICNGNIANFGVIIDPPGSPVSFSARNPSIVQVTAQGTNLTITMLTDGKTTVESKLGSAVLAEMQVRCGTISFPANAWFALRGVPQEFEFTLSPELSASELTFTIANPNIATVAAVAPSGLLVTGVTNGTTQISASIEPGQVCVDKAVTIFEAKLLSVEFTSDHNLLRDGPDVLTPGARFPDVEWTSYGAFPVNWPMTHTASDSIKVTTSAILTIAGLPTATLMALSGKSDEPGLNFGATNTYGSTTYAISLQSLFPIGKEIRFINKNIDWSLTVGGTKMALAASGPHRIYTTLGTPLTGAPSGASFPNVPRMNLAMPSVVAAIASASASPTAYTCYPRIVWHVVNFEGAYSLTNGTLNDVEAWQLPQRPPRDCIAIARFARNVCMVMGVPGAFEAKTYMAYYRTPTNPNRPNEALEGTLYPPLVKPGDQGPTSTTGLNSNWFLQLADRKCVGAPSGVLGDVGCSGGLNNFEAAVVYTDTAGKTWYFPAGATGSPRFDNKDGCVRLFQSMVWCSATGTAVVVEKVDHFYMPMDTLTDAQLCP